MSAIPKMQVNWTGDQELFATLTALPGKMQVSVIKPAVDKIARRIAKDIKNETPIGVSGLLKASIGVRTKRNLKSGRVWAVIGPRRSFRKVSEGDITAFVARSWRGRIDKRLSKRGGKRTKIPTRYAHLVERGHKKRGSGRVEGQHFMQEAVTQHAVARHAELISEIKARFASMSAKWAAKAAEQ